MDPSSRPTFDELVTQLEQMIAKHAGEARDASPVDANAAADDETTGRRDEAAPRKDEQVETGDKPAACPCAAKSGALTNGGSKFDHDVYLVPGCSPSEKARCHYVQRRPAGAKPFEYVAFFTLL